MRRLRTAPAMDGTGTAVAALSSVRRAAEATRLALAHVHVEPGTPLSDVSHRLSALVTAMREVDAAVTSGGVLRYQALRPVMVPTVAGDVPQFLRTKREPASEVTEAKAVTLGTALGAAMGAAEMNARVAAIRRAYEMEQTAALRRMDAATTAALSALASADSGSSREGGGTPAGAGLTGGDAADGDIEMAR